MKQAFLLTLLGAALLVTGGCKSKSDSKDAIREGVMKHIAGMSGLNVNNMTVVVTQANIHGDKAEANVDIRAKNGDPSAPPMQLVYQMQKQGDEWVVIKGEPTGGMQHPKPGEMPPPGSMPPGHPTTGGSSGQMPANHPDFNSILKTAQPQGQQPSSQPAPSSAQQQSNSGTSNYAKP